VLISIESPLRSIPVALERRQALFLEGLRISFEMVDLAHTRLQNTLLDLATLPTGDAGALQQGLVAALLDAWSVVDSVNRLRGLVQHIPGIKRRNQVPCIHNFFTETECVIAFRNTVQHLETTIGSAATAKDWSVWGSLSWCVPHPETSTIQSCMFASGMMRPGERPIINPLQKQIRLPVGLITLTQDNHSVVISDLVFSVEKLAKGTEAAFADSFNAEHCLGERYGADSVVVVDIALVPPPGVDNQV
jgi:hypothetical protein